MRVEYGPELAMFGVVHLQDSAPDTRCPDGSRDHDSLVPAANSLDVVIVRDVGRACEGEYRLAARGDPVAAVGVGPGHGALGVHLPGDLREVVAVVRCVPVELEDGCSVTGIDDGLVSAHGIALSYVR